ncbi:MAG: hypothetical protein ABEI07_00690 [Candidatus Nanohaloarchaea archaeon]
MQRRESLDVDGGTELCTFCYPSEEEDILYEDDKVYVMPALGQFVEGYLLLINRDHKECFAEVIDDDRKRVKDRVKEVLEDEYGSYCFFEHGRVGSCLDRASNRICYHAHIHALPVPQDFTGRVEEDFERIPVDDIREVSGLREEHPHYFYLETFNGRKSFFAVDRNVERQYMKKRACEAMGISEEKADYVNHPFREKMRKTAQKLENRI